MTGGYQKKLRFVNNKYENAKYIYFNTNIPFKSFFFKLNHLN